MSTSRRLGPILRPDIAAKIRWRMRFDRNPLLVTVQDKFAVRGFAQARGVNCAPLLHVTQDPTTIPFDALPSDCMVKASHGWSWNIARIDGRYYLFEDGRLFASHDETSRGGDNRAVHPLTVDEVIATCWKWLGSRLNRKSWAYQPMIPRIVVEETLRPREGSELLDFRLYTFNGDVRAISIGSPRIRRDSLKVFLRPDWSVMPLTSSVEFTPEAIPACPSTLASMIDIARRLGQELDFVRIDLYDTTRGIILGEMTVYPKAGNRGTPSGCPELDAWLGRQWSMSLTRHCGAAAWNIITWTKERWSELRRRWCR